MPAGIELSAVEQALAREPEKELRLRKNLRRSAMPYDYVLIDCPPSVGLLTFNALLAASEVIIPVDASYYSLQAVRKLKETLEVLREKRHHDIITRILLVNLDTRPRFTRTLTQEFEDQYGRELLETIIHRTVRFQEAAGAGLSVGRYDPGSRGALDFRNLAQEIVELEVDLSVTAIDHWIELLHGPVVSEESVQFVADFPHAKRVAVTGSFCNWSARGLPLSRRLDGNWECHAALPTGRHQYRYIVDGAWISDPNNTKTVSNEFGETNSLITVP
ncbi:MAG: AAA family ATPase [bacterium]